MHQPKEISDAEVLRRRPFALFSCCQYAGILVLLLFTCPSLVVGDGLTNEPRPDQDGVMDEDSQDHGGEQAFERSPAPARDGVLYTIFQGSQTRPGAMQELVRELENSVRSVRATEPVFFRLGIQVGRPCVCVCSRVHHDVCNLCVYVVFLCESMRMNECIGYIHRGARVCACERVRDEATNAPCVHVCVRVCVCAY